MPSLPLRLTKDYLHQLQAEQDYLLEKGIRADNRIQSDLDKQNFCYMGVQSWNMLPAEIRQERKLMVFKRKLRDWIKMNIAIR